MAKLTKADKDQIEREVLKKRDCLLRAIIVARSLIQDARRDTFRWIVGVLLALTAAAVTVIAAVMSEGWT